MRKNKKRHPIRDTRHPNIIAIVGPSASGKTSLANTLAKKLGKNHTAIISQDQYYKDWSHLPFKKRGKINFDSPGSFDFRMITAMLRRLQRWEVVEVPQYSYKLHKRLKIKKRMLPKRYIIVEGLLVLHKKSIRDLFNLKIYVDVDKATSLARRITRDLKSRGETIESVCKRYFEDVLPMQEKYVEPQKKWANFVLNGSNADYRKILDRLAQILKRR
ncbi:MAG: uridine kinase [Deltaproteobacteria bacterium]|nr:uridine kinase [Deltaproteobacteria bacterium]